ncbi:glycosyltransferase family 4 protein, partial [Klebsiella aerogenes]
ETFINYGIEKEIIVVRNPAIFNEIKKSEGVNENNAINIVFIGRLSPEKGVLEFINNLNNNCTLGINFHIYGKGPLANEIESIKGKVRSGLQIINHGFIDSSNILDAISQYDIFVLPSVWYENAPLSIIEAAIAGLPVLIPNTGGLLEMAKLTKHYYPFGDSEMNFDVIIKNAYLSKGKNEVLNQCIFSEEKYTKEIYDIYTG